MPEIAGPRGPIPYDRDALGYPSIRARDRVDAAFAHGFLIATDRLVQVHLLVLAGEGRLMEVLGESPVARTLDRIVRALDLAGDAEAEAESDAEVSVEGTAIVSRLLGCADNDQIIDAFIAEMQKSGQEFDEECVREGLQDIDLAEVAASEEGQSGPPEEVISAVFDCFELGS